MSPFFGDGIETCGAMISQPLVIDRPIDAEYSQTAERVCLVLQFRAAAGIREAAGAADKGERAFHRRHNGAIERPRTNKGRVQLAAVGCLKDEESNRIKGKPR